MHLNRARRRAAVLTAVLASLPVLAGVPAHAEGTGELRITEWEYNGSEFVELTNLGSVSVDTTGWSYSDSARTPGQVALGAFGTVVPGESVILTEETAEAFRLAWNLNDEVAVVGGNTVNLGRADEINVYDETSALVDRLTYNDQAPAGDPAKGPRTDTASAWPPAAAVGANNASTWVRSTVGDAEGSWLHSGGVFVASPGNTTLAGHAPGNPHEPVADPTDVRINEIESSGGTPGDWVELHNTGPVAVDITGWGVLDSDSSHTIAPFPAESIAPGGYYVVEEAQLGFGLGGGDSARLFAADGTTLIDSHDWTEHAATTYGRCLDGTGPFVVTASPTKGGANHCPLPAGADDVKVNEVESNGDVNDWIELHNTGAAAVDISGWVVRDNDDSETSTIPAGTTIAAGGFHVVETPVLGPGLGGADMARLFLPDGVTLVDAYQWAAHAPVTYGRCPDGTGDFAETVASTKGAANGCPQPFDPMDVRINEVESNGDTVGDWVELTNTGATPADISGWKVVDGDPAHPFAVVPDNTVLAPGGFFAMYTEFPPPGFGLGAEDTVHLYLADGTTEVDTYGWTGGHPATTYGRCPDGTGDFQVTTVATRGTANACSPIRVNEIESSAPDSGADFVELVNLSGADVDVAGWVIKDSTETNPTTLPSPTIVPAHGHLVLTPAAGLGGGDAVRLFDPAAKLIDTYAWTEHAVTTYGRCADGVGTFKDNDAATPGATNDCPGLQTEPWPGSQTVQTSDVAATFNADASGVAFDPADPRFLWVAQNKAGTLWRLTKEGATWVPAAGWETGRNPRYPDGTGAPDTEGLTIGHDGAVYMASERNNDASGISKNSVLRYDPSSSMNATDEWDLNPLLPALGANLGLEGVTFVPDSFLVGAGFVDESTGAAYDPSGYPAHGSGLYVVAVEGTGLLYVVALDQTAAVQEQAHLVATVDPELVTNAGPPGAMDVTWDPELARLWAVCDDSCDGITVTLAVDDAGAFVVDSAYDRPLGMPNLNNEGLALAPQSTCVDGAKEVVWASDGDDDGHSLRSGTFPCTEIPDVSPVEAPALTGVPVVGETLKVSTGSWSPASAAVTFQWYADGTPIAGATGTTYTLTAAEVGNLVRVEYVATASGHDAYVGATATLGPVTTSGPEPATFLMTAPPTITGDAVVGSTLTASPGSWSPAPTSIAYQWFADGRPIAGASAASYTPVAGDVGTVLTVRVTVSSPGFVDGVGMAGTAEVAPVEETPGEFEMTEPPSITGEPRVGKLLTGDAGSWSPAPETTTYRWLADGAPVAGATGGTLRLTPALVGAEISFEVTVAADGFTDGTAASDPTPAVRKGKARLTVTASPKRSTVREDRVRVRVEVTNADGVEADGTVTVGAGRLGPITLELVDGVATVRLPVFRRVGDRVVRVRYGGSDALHGTGTTVALKVVR